MSQQRLPPMTNLKVNQHNYDIALLMNNHRKRMEEVIKKKNSNNKVYATIAYKDLIQQNPKRNYLLQTKYTQIERENRLLFQKITGLSKNKQKRHSSFSHHQIGTLNTTFRKQQIQEIQRQNVKMFGRIQKQKASISFRQTDRDYFRNKEISQRLSNLNKNKLHDWYN